jgi:hypothetical protein
MLKGMSFCLTSERMEQWKNGIVEEWNSGFSKKIIHIKLYRQIEFHHLPDLAVKQDPFLQYSNIPPFQLGDAPNLNLISD